AITLTVNVASNAAASVTNTATVSGGGETNTSNDTATDVTTINPPPDLTITKSHSGNFAQGQTGATYTITAANIGGTATSGTVSEPTTVTASGTPGAIRHVGGAAGQPGVTNQVMTFGYTPVGTNDAVVVFVACVSPTMTSMSLTAPGWTFTPISGLVGPSVSN